MKREDLLIEIGCEDLPARYVQPLALTLSTSIADGLRASGIEYQQSVRRYATPRRLAVIVANVASAQADREIERKGPKLTAAIRDGKPTQAGLGFAKSCGVKFESLAQENGHLVFRGTQKGRPTRECLSEIFTQARKAMDQQVPRRMRWGAGEESFARPVQWLVCLLGSEVVPIEAFGLSADNKTLGHRFHTGKPITLKSPVEYEKKLMAAKVWADFDSRRAEIEKQIANTAQQLKGAPHQNPELLDEVTALVEWPVVITGGMEERFLALPQEVIVATIEHNQRYFPVFGNDGKLLPRFIAVSNIESRDETEVVVGNERVVRPRLSDALFFWEQDRKQSQASLQAALDGVSFQKGLGSVSDKAGRIGAIGGKIAADLGAQEKTIREAAGLCKLDLVTRMVFEFPELQGIMGGYYAKGWCDDETVAAAIREHYQPTQSGGLIPSTPAGQVLALADKLDTLAGLYALGQKPTASKDPYALRRAALGVLRILIEGELDLDLAQLLQTALEQQPVKTDKAKLCDELLQFHWERLRAYYLDAGVAVETFESVIATGKSRPRDLDRRIRAVERFRQLPDSQKLAAAHKRVRNILRQAREKNQQISREIDRSLTEPAERQLVDAIYKLRDSQPGAFRIQGEVAIGDTVPAVDRYVKALLALASLQAPVDRFFDEVMVMAEDPAVRANRLALMAELDELCRSVADISCLPG